MIFRKILPLTSKTPRAVTLICMLSTKICLQRELIPIHCGRMKIENEAIPNTAFCNHPLGEVDEPISRNTQFQSHCGLSWTSNGIVLFSRQIRRTYTVFKRNTESAWIQPRSIIKLLADKKRLLPFIKDLFNRLAHFAIALSMDLRHSFLQFPLRKQDRIKTTEQARPNGHGVCLQGLY